MIIRLRILAFYIFFLGVLFLAAFSWSVPVQANPVNVSYSLGFDGTFSLYTWTPLSLTLENAGRPIGGSIEVIVTSGSEYYQSVHETIYSKNLELPTNSKKIYAFNILIDSFTHPVIIRVKENEKIIFSTSINLRSHYTTDRLAVFLGRKTDADILPALSGGLKPVHARPEFLPEAWYGYDGVEMLVLQGSMMNSLREAQFTALRDWVENNGGYLVLSGEINYGVFSLERARSLLALNIVGLKRTSALESFERFTGEKLISPNPFLILNAELEGGTVLLWEKNVPLITRTGFGLGEIIFLAFDSQSPPFSAWSGRHVFWAKILNLKARPEAVGLDLDREKMIALAGSKISFRPPLFFPSVFMFLSYVIIVWILFIFMGKSKIRRREYISLMILAITVFSVMSLGVYAYKYNRNKLTYNALTHLTLSNNTMIASMKTVIGVYSLKGGQHQMNFGQRPHPIKMIRPQVGSDRILQLALRNDPLSQAVIRFDRWSHCFFEVDSKIYFPIRGWADLDNQGLTLTIENMTPHRIVGGQIYFKDRFFAMGDIPPDGRYITNLPASVEGGDDSDSNMRRLSYGASPFLVMFRDNLLKPLITSVPSKYEGHDEILYLFAWMDSDVLPVGFPDSKPNGDAAVLLEWKMPVNDRGVHLYLDDGTDSLSYDDTCPPVRGADS